MATIQNLVGANKIKDEWQKINNNFAALNSAKMEKTADSNLDMNSNSIRNIASLGLKTPAAVTSISGGAITVTQSYHVIDTEGSAPTDDLDTINGGSPGDRLILRQNNSSRKVTIKHGTGNIRTSTGSDITLDLNTSAVELLKIDANIWIVLNVQGVKRTGDTMTGRLQINDQLYYGTGSPQGNLTASPGSIYQNLSGGTGTTIYYKASGTGNTGWVAIA